MEVKKDAEQVSRNFLREIYKPNIGTPEIDIIAVHGLNPGNSDFHAENTWTKGGKLWLKDFLPHKVPTARVLLFGYNANVAFEASTSGVLEQAHNLLYWIRVRRRRENAEQRPIIFIAHSLGGIVVKRALVVASQVEKHKSIRAATYGIVFFATPHRGGEHVMLGGIAAKIVRAVYAQPKNDFLEALQKDSMFGNTMIDDFRSMLEDFKVISFFETRPLPHIGIVVDKISANLGLSHDRETNMGLDLDHRQICKFDHTDLEYEIVEDNILEMIEEAIESKGMMPASTPASPPVSPDPAAATSPALSTPQLTPSLPSPAIIPESQPSPAIVAENVRPPSESSFVPPHLQKSSTYAESMRSLTLIDSADDSERRHSSSTGITSAASAASAASIDTATQAKISSPRLLPAIAMNIWDSSGSAFRKAAAQGRKDQVMSMLSNGQIIDNCGAGHGFTALAEAALHGHEDIVKLLLEKGANPAYNCISTLAQFGSKENTPLALAAGKGHLPCVKTLLDAHAYDRDELDRAFRSAKYRNRTDVMKLINERGGGLY